MAIKITDTLQPNGTSFVIGDINDIKGGVHYVNTYNDLYYIHRSRLVDGMLCLVRDERLYYQYSEIFNTWTLYNAGSLQAVNSSIAAEVQNWDVSQYQTDGALVYVIDENRYYQAKLTDASVIWTPRVDGLDSYYLIDDGIPLTEHVAHDVGNISTGMTLNDLKGLTISELLTKMLFNENSAYVKYKASGSNTVKTRQTSYDTGSALTVADLTTTVATAEYAYVRTPGVSAVSKKTKAWTAGTPTLSSANYVIGYGTNTNAYACTFDFTPPTDSSGNIIKLYSGWNYSQNAVALALQQETVHGNVTGSYTIYWKYGTVSNDMITKGTDIENWLDSSLTTDGDFTMTSTVSNKQIGSDTVTGLNSTAFLYFYIPASLTLSSITIRNGATGQYEAIPSTWITQTSYKAYRSSTGTLTSESANARYVYNVYQVAKSNQATAGMAPTQAPIKISIS